jgi:hypothetical protein
MKALLVVFLGLVCCGCNTADPGCAQCNPCVVKFGEIVCIPPDGLTLKFERVTGDSRCPLDVMCVWEGRADILLRFVTPGRDPVFVKASIYGYVMCGDTARHVRTDTLGYRFKLLQLDPYPRTVGPRNYLDYVAFLSVSKL